MHTKDGNVTVERYRDGRLYASNTYNNRFVKDGRTAVRDLLCGAGVYPTHLALGTGTTLPADTDVALEVESFRNAITRYIPYPSRARIQLYLLSDQANDTTFTEMGLFAVGREGYSQAAAGLATGGGTMLARVSISESKTSGETMVITWDLPIQSTD